MTIKEFWKSSKGFRLPFAIGWGMAAVMWVLIGLGITDFNFLLFAVSQLVGMSLFFVLLVALRNWVLKEHHDD